VTRRTGAPLEGAAGRRRDAGVRIRPGARIPGVRVPGARVPAAGLPLQRIDFELRGEYIALDALLKATGLAGSGGSAKHMITDGQVRVDGQVELRRSCKLRAGRVAEVAGARIHVCAATP
jgi:ribosome-associated protein